MRLHPEVTHGDQALAFEPVVRHPGLGCQRPRQVPVVQPAEPTERPNPSLKRYLCWDRFGLVAASLRPTATGSSGSLTAPRRIPGPSAPSTVADRPSAGAEVLGTLTAVTS